MEQEIAIIGKMPEPTERDKFVNNLREKYYAKYQEKERKFNHELSLFKQKIEYKVSRKTSPEKQEKKRLKMNKKFSEKQIKFNSKLELLKRKHNYKIESKKMKFDYFHGSLVGSQH